jgi:hypothetical protein
VPLMRRRPLLRAAAVGGGAYMAGKQRARSQEQDARQDDQIYALEGQAAAPAAAPPAPAAPASAGPSRDAIERLTQLATLRDQGILTDEEFTRQKTLLLDG